MASIQVSKRHSVHPRIWLNACGLGCCSLDTVVWMLWSGCCRLGVAVWVLCSGCCVSNKLLSDADATRPWTTLSSKGLGWVKATRRYKRH